MAIVSFLKTERLILSPIDIDNISFYHEFINIQENDIFTEHAEFPHSLESLVDFINAKSTSRESILLGIYTKDKLLHIGNIELDSINFVHKTAEYKIILDYKSAKQGFAYEASKVFIDHAFNKLNLYKIKLGVNVENTNAMNLYKKLGFIEEAILKEELLKEGRRVDIMRMAYFNKLDLL